MLTLNAYGATFQVHPIKRTALLTTTEVSRNDPERTRTYMKLKMQ